MGRSYQAEQLIQQHFDGLLARKAGAQVGLLVGKQAVGARDLLLSLVQTPLKVVLGSAAAAPKGTSKKGAAQASAGSSGAASAVVIDVEWVEQHATQVARMLPGGLSLLGCYLFSSEPAYQSAIPQLCNILQALRDLLPPGAGEELVVIHADAGSRKVTARSSTAGSSSSLSPAELKFAACLPNLMTITCRWPLQLALPAATSTASLLQQVQQVKDEACAHIRSGLAFLSDGAVPADETLLVDLPGVSTSSTQDSLPQLQVQLLPLQGHPDAAPEAANGAASNGAHAPVTGQGTLRGWLHGCAVVHKRQSWASASHEVMIDLSGSLSTRVELLEEDALSWQDEQQQQDPDRSVVPCVRMPLLGCHCTGAAAGSDPRHPLMDKTSLTKPYTSAMAQRVQLTGIMGSLPVFDHLLPGEGAADAAARAVELLAAHNTGLDVDALAQQVVMFESEASTNSKLAPWNPLSLPATAASEHTQHAGSKAKHGVDCSTMMLSSAAAGAVAAVATVAMYLMGWFKL